MGINDSVPYVRLVDESFQKRQKTSQEWKKIRRQRLINSLNRINFQDGEVTLNFKHPKYKYILSLPAIPQPCKDESLNCIWDESIEYKTKLKDFEFKNFHFTDGLKKILVEAELLDINKKGVQLSLPEKCHEISTRKLRRYQCKDVIAQLSQDGIVLKGFLTSFSAVSFSVKTPKDSPGFQHDFNRNDHVNVVLMKGAVPLYSGICEIYRISDNPDDGNVIILKPIKSQIQRFKSKKHRSIRQRLLPSPNIFFQHPLTGKKVNLRALDISGAGFSVQENIENSLLIPGLVIPVLSIELMSGVELTCQTQVIYRSIEEPGHVKCGMAYLDMPLRDQIRLSSLLHQGRNKNTYVSNKVDANDVWDFFFETGFIYPQKYSFIQANKAEFNKIFKKLYEKDSDLAINFIYKDRGSILAHMSMFRYYEKTWIINHHAAISSRNNRAGLIVLEQISSYINDFHRLKSTMMQYVACYFRPENRFPNLVFGGVVKKASDPKSCSVDKFAYVHFQKGDITDDVTGDWKLLCTKQEDLKVLEQFYEKESGGLTLHALDLHSRKKNKDGKINETYRRAGLKRRRHIFSLKNKKKLIAVFIVNISDLGMNMSDLTNCIQVFVLDSDSLPGSTMHFVLNILSKYYEHEDFPVLCFPSTYTEQKSIQIDKIYNFWVLDVHRIGDRYYEHLGRLLRHSSR